MRWWIEMWVVERLELFLLLSFSLFVSVASEVMM